MLHINKRFGATFIAIKGLFIRIEQRYLSCLLVGLSQLTTCTEPNEGQTGKPVKNLNQPQGTNVFIYLFFLVFSFPSFPSDS